MITASTALFGAPFWFDLMQRVVRMRGTGAKPEESASVRVEGRIAASVPATPRV
jgi:hypothetical protein